MIKVDDEYLLKKHKWYIEKSTGYARSRINSRIEYLHRYIMKCSPKDKRIIDHINGDKLDNRMCNLRFVTKSQNNRKRYAKHYYQDKIYKRYHVSFSYNSKTLHFGSFKYKKNAINMVKYLKQKIFVSEL